MFSPRDHSMDQSTLARLALLCLRPCPKVCASSCHEQLPELKTRALARTPFRVDHRAAGHRGAHRKQRR